MNEWNVFRCWTCAPGGTPKVQRLGTVTAPNWSDAMHRAAEKFGGGYGGMAVEFVR